VEDAVYATIAQLVQTDVHTQTISAAVTFLPHFPPRVRRSQVQFWLAEALYATRAHRHAAEVYQALRQHTLTGPGVATVVRQLGLSYLYSRQYNAAVATFAEAIAVWQYVLLTFPVSPQHAEW
jgi:TolA-binding protein